MGADEAGGLFEFFQRHERRFAGQYMSFVLIQFGSGHLRDGLRKQCVGEADLSDVV